VATLTVWKFDTPSGAEDAAATLARLAREQLIVIDDAATVTWPEGRKKPKTHQLHNLTASGALGGSFWGLLFGLLFLMPLLGLAVGAAAGAMTGVLSDVGIDDDFIHSVRASIQPGTSALFLMTSGAVVDKVVDAFEGTRAELIHTNLSGEQEEQLQAIFGED
jgi:uncharacterized membrane protein